MKPRTIFSKKDILVVFACVVFLLINLGAIGTTGRGRAKEAVCQINLKQLGYAQDMFLNDNDGYYPSPWTSLVETEYPVPGYSRVCRWHDPRYPLDGPLWAYLRRKNIALCPTFQNLAKHRGQAHPGHDSGIPIDPLYSYIMNARLGGYYSSGLGVQKFSQITRSKAEVFFFAEENLWTRPGCNYVLNDTALIPDGRDWFGTFHNAPHDDLNAGVINAVFVDGHVQKVRSALGKDYTDKSQMEFGQFEKYGWPFSHPYE